MRSRIDIEFKDKRYFKAKNKKIILRITLT